MNRPYFVCGAILVAALLHGACGSATESPAEPVAASGAALDAQNRPAIIASNAFYYYADVESAWRFYANVLGFETVADYGFAKIMRVAPASYLTLVDAAEGMHSADEPKTVTLALVTEEVEGWYDYLMSRGVPMRGELSVTDGRPHDGFVAIDPEGYFLEFERFNPHPENDRLMPVLDGIEALYVSSESGSSRPADLGIQATVLWLYYVDVPGAQAFYEQAMGLPLMVDQGWAKMYPLSGTGFLGLVDAERGLHKATEQKGVTVSFFVDDVDRWFGVMEDADGFELRTDGLTDESGRVRVFVGYDPEGYFLEWDTFLDVAGNEELLRQIRP